MFVQKKFLQVCFLTFVLYCVVILHSAKAHAQSAPAGLEAAVAAAHTLHWGEERQWKLILYYYQSWVGEHTLIDDDGFFFDPHGGSQPGAELDATLKALYEASPDLPEQKSPHCRFPMRTAWLARRLKERGLMAPERPCP